MAVKTSWSAGDVLAAADLTDTFAAKAASSAVGLSYITAQSFSTAASVSVNDCFTSSYANYRVLINIDSSSGTQALAFRLRVSSSDNTSANYGYAYLRNIFSTGGLANYSNGATETKFGIGEGNSSQPLAIVLDIANPQRTVKTSYSFSADSDTSHYAGGGMMTVTTSYTGFTIFPSTGNITGDVRVYGLKN